LNQLQTFLM